MEPYWNAAHVLLLGGAVGGRKRRTTWLVADDGQPEIVLETEGRHVRGNFVATHRCQVERLQH